MTDQQEGIQDEEGAKHNEKQAKGRILDAIKEINTVTELSKFFLTQKGNAKFLNDMGTLNVNAVDIGLKLNDIIHGITDEFNYNKDYLAGDFPKFLIDKLWDCIVEQEEQRDSEKALLEEYHELGDILRNRENDSSAEKFDQALNLLMSIFKRDNDYRDPDGDKGYSITNLLALINSLIDKHKDNFTENRLTLETTIKKEMEDKNKYSEPIIEFFSQSIYYYLLRESRK